MNRLNPPARNAAIRKKRLALHDSRADAPLATRGNHMSRLLRLEALEERTLLSVNPGDLVATFAR